MELVYSERRDGKVQQERVCSLGRVNRLVMPGSECDTYAWLQSQVYTPEWQGLELHHLYRSLDFLDKHMPVVEEQLFFWLRDLFSLEVKLVLFDTTSSYFEGRGRRV